MFSGDIQVGAEQTRGVKTAEGCMLGKLWWPRGSAVGSAAPLSLCNEVLREGQSCRGRSIWGEVGRAQAWASGDLSSSPSLLPNCWMTSDKSLIFSCLLILRRVGWNYSGSIIMNVSSALTLWPWNISSFCVCVGLLLEGRWGAEALLGVREQRARCPLVRPRGLKARVSLSFSRGWTGLSILEHRWEQWLNFWPDKHVIHHRW